VRYGTHLLSGQALCLSGHLWVPLGKLTIMRLGPFSHADSTSGWTAGHPELSAIATYDNNVKRQKAWQRAHPGVEILEPCQASSWCWLARWREGHVPDDADRVIYNANDLGMLLDRLERQFG
jgi:hypothetical protein